MKTASTIAASIDSAADRARYDAACKQILAEKIILAWIMKSTTREYASINVQEIAEKYIIGTPQVGKVPVMPDETNAPKISGVGVEDATMTEGTVTFDIRFYAILPSTGEQVGLIVNIEAQNDFYPGYPLIKRAIYYCSRMISSQYGTEFTNSHYEKIKKVYSIWICTNPPEHRKNTIASYGISETDIVGHVQEKPENYDLITVVMICLGNQGEAESGGLLRLLDVLLSGNMDTAAKKRILSEDYKIPMTQQFERRIGEMCNLSEGILQKGIEQGIEQGIERGIERGIEQGMEQGVLTSVKNLMETLHLSMEQAMDALKVSSDDRERYRSLILADK